MSCPERQRKARGATALLVFFLLLLGGCRSADGGKDWTYKPNPANKGADISVQIDFLEKRLQTRPDSFLEMAELAGCYFSRGKTRRSTTDLEKSQEWAEKSLEKFPNSAAYLVKADYLQLHHRFDEALAVLEKVLEQEPGNPSALILATRISLAQGNPEAASRRLSQVPDDPLPGLIFLRGEVLEAQGDLKGARSAYQAALDSETVSGTPSESARMRGVWARLELEEGNLEKAQALLEAAHAIPVEQPLTEVLRARLMVANKDFKGASQLLRAAFEHYRDPLFLVRLGEVQWESGEKDKAKDTFATAAQLLKADSLGHERDLALALFYVDAKVHAQEIEELMTAELKRREDKETRRIEAIVSSAYKK